MDLDGASRVVFSWRFFCPAVETLYDSLHFRDALTPTTMPLSGMTALYNAKIVARCSWCCTGIHFMPAKRNIYRQPDSCFSLYTFIYFVYFCLEKRYDTIFQQCILSRNLSLKTKKITLSINRKSLRNYLWIFKGNRIRVAKTATLETLYLHKLWTRIHAVGYTCPDLTRRANLQLRAGAIIRDELSQRCCRSLLPSQKTRGKDKNWENRRDRVRNLRILCVPPSVQNCFPEERENATERDRGWRKTLRPIVGTGELEDTRGLHPAHPLSAPRASTAMILVLSL